ncbi:MAG: HepT-like ribonuclease domain-containing protein [Actinomycetota bacterium]
MPEDEASVLDMLEAARAATKYVGDMDRESYLDDSRTQLAVERLLEIVGEGARRVRPNGKRILVAPD